VLLGLNLLKSLSKRNSNGTLLNMKTLPSFLRKKATPVLGSFAILRDSPRFTDTIKLPFLKTDFTPWNLIRCHLMSFTVIIISKGAAF
jgi:hypothetical protein